MMAGISNHTCCSCSHVGCHCASPARCGAVVSVGMEGQQQPAAVGMVVAGHASISLLACMQCNAHIPRHALLPCQAESAPACAGARSHATDTHTHTHTHTPPSGCHHHHHHHTCSAIDHECQCNAGQLLGQGGTGPQPRKATPPAAGGGGSASEVGGVMGEWGSACQVAVGWLQ